MSSCTAARDLSARWQLVASRQAQTPCGNSCPGEGEHRNAGIAALGSAKPGYCAQNAAGVAAPRREALIARHTIGEVAGPDLGRRCRSAERWSASCPSRLIMPRVYKRLLPVFVSGPDVCGRKRCAHQRLTPPDSRSHVGHQPRVGLCRYPGSGNGCA